jgi:hypothetical protein
MELDWWSSLEWVVLFIATCATVFVVYTVMRSSHCLQPATDLLQAKGFSRVFRTGRPRISMLLKTRLRMGNADDESDQSSLLV